MRKSTRYYLLALVVTLSLWKVSDSGGFSPDYNSGSTLTPAPPLNVPTLHPNMIARDPVVYAHYGASAVFSDLVTQDLNAFPTNYAMTEGAVVGVWQDSISSWTASTSSATANGYYCLATGTNSVQGLPAVQFNKTGGLLTKSGFWDPLTANGWTAIVLSKPGTSSTTYRVMASNTGSVDYYFGYRPRVGGYNTWGANINTTIASFTYGTAKTGNMEDAPLTINGTANGTSYENGTTHFVTVSSTGFVQVGLNGYVMATAQASTTKPSGKLQLGDGGVTGFPMSGPMADITFYQGVLTDAQLKKECSRIQSLGTAPTPLVIVDWNSFGGGYNNSYLRNELAAPFYMKSLLNNPNVIQFSISGDTTFGKITNTLPGLKLFGNNQSYRKVAYLLWEGTNDMHSGSGNKTAAQAWANYQIMITSAAQFGIRDIFVGTVICRNDGQTFEDRRVAFNALVRNNAPALGASLGVNVIVVDIPVLLPQYNVTTSTANPTYYVDGIHPSRQGYSLINNEWAKAIQTQWYKETTIGF